MEEYELNEEFWNRPYPASVYRMFAALKQACEQFPGEDDGKLAVEVEARLGDTLQRQSTNRFSPGVSQTFFDKVKGVYFKQKPPTSETYDVTFKQSKIRVSVDVSGGNVRVVEVMKKAKDTIPPADVSLKPSPDGLQRGANHCDFRVSLMVEQQIDPQFCLAECDAAVRWVHEALQPASADVAVKIRGISMGCPCHISQSAGDSVRPILAPLEFAEEKGWLQSQLKWTLLTTARLRGLDGNLVSLNEHMNLAENSEVIVSNLPGAFNRDDGSSLPLAAFEIQLLVKVKDLIPLTTEQSMDNVSSLPPVDVFVRHKRRWKYSFENKSIVIDLTQTRQGETPADLQASEVKYEMEIERCCSINQGRFINPVEETVELLKASASILYSSSIKYPSDSIKRSWTTLAIPRLTLEKMEFRSMMNAFPPSMGAANNARKRPSDGFNTNDQKRVNMGSEGDAVALVGSHTSAQAEDFYNSLTRNREDRHRSLIFHMRCLNNFAKSCLLNHYLRLVPDQQVRVLELACGKGADLGKMRKSGRHIVKYVGTDIAKQSLEEAVSRAQSNPKAAIKDMKLIAADLTKCDLRRSDWGSVEGLDVYDRGNWTKTTNIFDRNDRFNFVSMQFSLHYMFASREIVERFFRGVASRLDLGARFVATTVSSDALMTALLRSPNGPVVSFMDDRGRETCHIEFEQESYERLLHNSRGQDEDWFGLRYRFKLLDGDSEENRAVDAPEYLIVNSALLPLVESCGLRVELQYRLTDFANIELHERGEESRRLWRQMNVSNQDGTISEIEWSIASLYQVLVFQKVVEVESSSDVMMMTNVQETVSTSDAVVEPEEDTARLYIMAMTTLRNTPGWDDLSDAEKNDRVEAAIARMRAAAS